MKPCALLLALALGTGCGNSVAPLRGDLYVLTSIAGVTLPAPYATNTVEDIRILADTIALGADGKGVRRTLYGGYPAPQATNRQEGDLWYSRTADHVEINYVCRDTNDCIPGPHLSGTITEAGITIDQSTVQTLMPLVYSRVSR